MAAEQPVSESCEEPSTNTLGTADESTLVLTEIQNVVQDSQCAQTEEWVECVECSRFSIVTFVAPLSSAIISALSLCL